MTAARTQLTFWFTVLSLAACGEGVDPSHISAPSLAITDDSRHTVIVNPNANGNGVAATIQEGIDMVADGGTVLVKPGTYAERIVIDKGLTLAPIAWDEGPVIIA